MNPLNQLSIVWQVWGAMLLGAVLLMAGLVVGIEWPWIKASARSAWQWLADLAYEIFVVDVEPTPTTLTTIDADEILIAARGAAFRFRSSDAPPAPPFPFTPIAPHDDDAKRRRQLLALAESSPTRRTVVH